MLTFEEFKEIRHKRVREEDKKMIKDLVASIGELFQREDMIEDGGRLGKYIPLEKFYSCFSGVDKRLLDNLLIYLYLEKAVSFIGEELAKDAPKWYKVEIKGKPVAIGNCKGRYIGVRLVCPMAKYLSERIW